MLLNKKLSKPLAYLCMPVVFCVLGYLIVWVAIQPVWSSVSSAVGMLLADDAPNFNDSLTSVYDPDAWERLEHGDYIDGKDVDFPVSGSQYGQLTCASLGLDAPVYWYDSDEILSFGVGQSIASFPPGFGRVIILAGHNTTYFAPLEKAKKGDVIRFSTNWCPYEYTVTDVEVLKEDDLGRQLSALGQRENEELIMYTCWPFEVLGWRKTDRLVVHATRTDGLDVRWRS